MPPPPTPDPTAAVAWYRKAVEGGLAEANYMLGLAYREGRGVPQDMKAAAAVFERAAQSNHPVSQFELAVMYCNASGVPRDLERALVCYEAAARAGHRLAVYNFRLPMRICRKVGLGCAATAAVPDGPGKKSGWKAGEANEDR